MRVSLSAQQSQIEAAEVRVQEKNNELEDLRAQYEESQREIQLVVGLPH